MCMCVTSNCTYSCSYICMFVAIPITELNYIVLQDTGINLYTTIQIRNTEGDYQRCQKQDHSVIDSQTHFIFVKGTQMHITQSLYQSLYQVLTHQQNDVSLINRKLPWGA